jgi:uncharacterized tellurite resistance protein B-like protein
MSKQNIHIAMGSLAYAIAKADGQIQDEEKKLIRKLAQQEFDLENTDSEWIENMFVKLEKDNISLEDAYNYAIDTLESNRFEFDFDLVMKNKCIKFMQKIAEAFQDAALNEQKIIDRFKTDIIKY